MIPYLIFFFFFFFLIFQSSIHFSAMAANSNLFREYTGALRNGALLSEVPINPGVDFHFILSFAIDYTTSTSPPTPTNGQFKIYWDTRYITVAAVASIKQQYPNVKFALSLGGYSLSGYPVNFSINGVDAWVSNAVSSLTPIIQQYHLDGIDVDYENFPANVSPPPNTFALCIGRLLTTLKNNGVVSFTSIAPFPKVQSYYTALWNQYSAVIDYVNFQFYSYRSGQIGTVDQFLSYYNLQAANYPGGEMLASFNTAPNAGGLTPANGFFNACSILQQAGSLPGIFVWSADNSHGVNNSYAPEKQAQQLLAGH